MKHLSYFLFGATALLMASCSNEDLVSSGLNPDGTANVTLTLSTPQIQTRAYSDGTKAQKFIYGLYDITDAAEGEIGVYLDNITPVSDSNPDAINLKKTMSFRLLADRKYRFVCFADAGENTENSVKSSPYDVKIDDEGATIGYNFSTKPTWANQETYDAFYASREFSITGNISLDIEMFRPLAQINVGTNDIDDAAALGFQPVLSGLAFPVETNVPSKIDLITGEVLESQAFQFMPNVVADRNETFPVKGYEYLTMVYLLAPEEQTLYDIELNYSGNDNVEHKRTVGSVPVKRNHRTNIYGQILTSDAALNIQIEPDFDDPDLQPSELEMVAALGGTVVLDDDVTLEDGKNITFIKDAIVDLNGKNVTGASDLDGVFVIDNGANVTIKGPGKVAVGDNDEDYGIAVWAENGTVTIEGGTYEAKGETALIYSTGGTIIIKGGTFKIDDPKGQPFTLNIQDELVKDGTDPRKFIEVRGGTFVNYDPSHSASENPVANFVAKGYVVRENQIDNDTYYTVVPEGNKEAVVEMINGKAYCLAPALPEGATEEQLEAKGGLYVEDGEVKPFEATTAGIIGALKNGTEIYFAPNSTVSLTQSHMQVQPQGITVYGNGATFGGSGEWDFSVQSYGPGATNYPMFEEGSTVNVNIYDLNNVKVWGALNQDVNLNVYLKNCTLVGNGLNDGSHSLIMVRGADEGKSKVNITLEDCYAKNTQVAIHTMYVGKITVNNCEFEEVGIPVNYAKKLVDENAEVIVKDCIFNKCGMEPLNDDYDEGAANYAAPIRVVDNGGPDNSVSLLVDNCTFNNTLSNWDILLMEYRKAKEREWFAIKYSIQNCVTEPTVREK